VLINDSVIIAVIGGLLGTVADRRVVEVGRVDVLETGHMI
jgi:hypothetical protein